MTLGDLLPDIGLAPPQSGIPVAGLTTDSRSVSPGFVFFAVPGTRSDGLSFAAGAVAAGAVAVVSERGPPGDIAGAASVVVPNLRRSLSSAARRFYPGQPETVVAVTGTSGKTSVAAFVRQIWAASGRRAASLGTLGVIAPEGAIYGSLTTPDPIALHRSLDELAHQAVTHLALEASSHGLDQHRLDGVTLAGAAFTNLSRDHLDYHPTTEHYLAAKLRLFEDLLDPGKPAVIDADSDIADRVCAAARARGLAIMTVGRRGTGIELCAAEPEGYATRLALRHAGRSFDIGLPLPGLFQVSNALVAAGLCIVTGTPADVAFAALKHLTGAPGRLEQVGSRRGAPIFVDYAHKPDALQNVLTTLRPYAAGTIDRGVRLRRRPRSGQARAHGRDRGTTGRPRDRDGRQPALRTTRHDPGRHSGRHAGRVDRHRDR